MFFLQNILRYISPSSYLESGLTTGNRYYDGSVVIVTFIMKQLEPFWNWRICCLDLLDKNKTTFTVHIEYHLIRSAMRNKNTQLPHNTQEGDEGLPDQAAPLHYL